MAVEEARFNPSSPVPKVPKILRFLGKEEKEGADMESSPKVGMEWSEFLRRRSS